MSVQSTFQHKANAFFVSPPAFTASFYLKWPRDLLTPFSLHSGIKPFLYFLTVLFPLSVNSDTISHSSGDMSQIPLFFHRVREGWREGVTVSFFGPFSLDPSLQMGQVQTKMIKHSRYDMVWSKKKKIKTTMKNKQHFTPRTFPCHFNSA